MVPSLHPLPAAAPHQHLSRESQAQPGLQGGGREAHQGGQQHHTGRQWSARQVVQVWRRKEGVCDSKWKKKKTCEKCKLVKARLEKHLTTFQRMIIQILLCIDAQLNFNCSQWRLEGWKLHLLISLKDSLLFCFQQCVFLSRMAAISNTLKCFSPLLLCSSSSRCSILSAAWAGSAETNAATCPPQ